MESRVAVLRAKPFKIKSEYRNNNKRGMEFSPHFPLPHKMQLLQVAFCGE